MMVRTLILSLRSRLAGFAGDRRAVSAVEFAILLPVMIGFYLGSVETTEGIAISQQVSVTAATIANLVSQSTSINNAQMSDILAASSAVLTPYPVANATVVVSSITIDANGNATVAWSDTLNGTARPVGQVVTLPAALDVANTSVILGEATYAFTPDLGYVITGTLTLSGSMYYAPRMSTSVTRCHC
ncbi:MAG: TadE/TadG family type IV pilus assembly protein [Xanthobacteraceae bacterium]